MKRILFDAEGDGLTPTLLWCLSLMDIDTGDIVEYGPDKILEGLKVLEKAELLMGHNIICYDIPVILRLYNIDLSSHNLIDTLVLSRLFNPTQEGGHSLEAWGLRLGFPKVEHEDWSKYSKGMQRRCTMDVRLNYKVFKKLEPNYKVFSQDSIDLEHEVSFILYEQKEHGWLFNVPAAELLLAQVTDELGKIEDKVHETFKPKVVVEKVVTPKLKADGKLSKVGLRPEEYDKLLSSGSLKPFNRYRTQVFNLNSRQQIGEWLIDFGWEPSKFTPGSKGKPKSQRQPQVDEKVLSEIEGIPEAELINEYLATTKIKGFLTNWLDSVGEDDRQHGYVNTMGAVTGRMSHSKPNLAQVPSSRKPFGAECRALFTVPKGYKLVGMDAKELELRMLSHYMDDDDYSHTVVNGDKKQGTDAHTVNMIMAGLSDRDQAKTMYYALIYGAGDNKMGQIIGGGIKEGRALKARVFNKLPALSDLIFRVQSAAAKGYIKGLDGRIIRIRSVYASLNTLLQGGGAVVMKRALVILRNLADKEGLDYNFVGNIHDEIQAEVLEEHSERFAELAELAMCKAGEYYEMRIALEGDATIGDTWLETH